MGKLISECCLDGVTVASDSFNSNREYVTQWYMCNKCGQPCDVVNAETYKGNEKVNDEETVRKFFQLLSCTNKQLELLARQVLLLTEKVAAIEKKLEGAYIK